MNFKIALLAGDGIGPEIIREAVLVLQKIGEKFSHTFDFIEADIGGIAIDKHNNPLPDETLKICKESDSVLLGAVGGYKWENLTGDMRPEAGLLKLRKELNLYCNLRPAVLHSALKDSCVLREDIAKKGFDIMVVRELTGGIYFGERGRKDNTAWDTESYSLEEVTRIAKRAFEIAMKRNKIVTSIDKSNVLESSRLWRETVIKVAKDYPEVKLNHMYVDNAAMQLIREPSQFDVIVTSNMFGDILSDEASQVTGSIGMLPSASLGTDNHSMYEPIHGSAPDIANQNIANPLATILSVAMMLKYSFNLSKESEYIEEAVSKVLEKGYRTADIFSEDNKKIGTSEMGQLVIDEM